MTRLKEIEEEINNILPIHLYHENKLVKIEISKIMMLFELEAEKKGILEGIEMAENILKSEKIIMFENQYYWQRKIKDLKNGKK